MPFKLRITLPAGQQLYRSRSGWPPHDFQALRMAHGQATREHDRFRSVGVRVEMLDC